METDATPETVVCAVCGEAADLKMTAECNSCDRRYHLNQRNDIEAKDCGHVWIDEQFLALQFACNDCVDGASPARGRGPQRGRASTGRPRRYRRRA